MDPTLSAILLSWKWRPDVAGVVLVGGITYVLGWRRLRRIAPATAPAWRLVLYLLGLLAIVLALLSPIDTLGSLLFVFHMAQHELLTMVAPPLLLLGNPLPALLWALPPRGRRWAGRLLGSAGAVRAVLRALTFLPVAWVVYVVTLWAWHHPRAYGLSLRVDAVHDVQHLSFFLAAVLFWWPIVDPAPHVRGYVHHGIRVVYAVPAALQSQALGLLFAFFSSRVLYPHYLAVPRLLGFSAEQDQSAAGLLMMQVEGLVYLGVILGLVAGLLRREERMTAWREQVGR
jgi:cytochrome c oxidase assembly factor CtaG